MGASSEPTTPARELGIQLHKERKRPRSGRPKGYRVTDIPKDICAERTLRDLETGQKPRVKPGMVFDLCEFYESDPDLVRELRALAKATQADKWWEAYSSGMANRFWLYLQAEGRATRLKSHDPTYVPLLLQHETYLDAVHASIRITWEKDDLDFGVAKQLTLDRQDRWHRAQTPLTCVIGEAALMLNMGHDVMDAQQAHLLDLAKRPYVTALVIPLAAGRHDVLGIEFNLIEFDDGHEDVIYVHGGYGGRYLSPDSRAGHFYTQSFNVAQDVSIPLEEYLA